MANMAKDRETAVEQDETARVADVIAALIRAGVLRWSALAKAPVTGRRDQLNTEIEEWMRHG